MKRDSLMFSTVLLTLFIFTLSSLNSMGVVNISNGTVSKKNATEINLTKEPSNISDTTNTNTNTNIITVKKASSDKIVSNTTENTRLSRGGTSPNKVSSKTLNENKNNSYNTYLPKIELLDWWKEARYVFAVDSVAEVTDVYTGKTFNIKRTMGTNHADSEALTREDTNIIKNIWGGFSWERRPVILKVNGKRLAASMSAMPHAGIDSAPAFSVVNNRSTGYGRGENLDVIKHNGMDGHFDIHFLNSTRHKDGKKDPQHQEAVLAAAKK